MRFWMGLLVAAGLLLDCPVAKGGWGSGGCGSFGGFAPARGPVGPSFFLLPPPPPLAWAWDGDQYNLMQGGVQIGAYDGRRYLPRVGTGWGSACAAPIPLPALPRVSRRTDCGCGGLGGCPCGPNCRCR